QREKTFAPFLVGPGRDGQTLLILARSDTDQHFHYYELSRDGALSSPLEPDDALHDRPVFHPTTGRLAGFVREGATPDYQLSGPALARIYEAGQDSAAGQSVRIAATARDPRRMVIQAQGGNDAGNYYFVDMVNGTYVDLGNDHAAIPAEWVANQSAIDYPSGDGLTIHALLTTPTKPEAKNLPLVVLPHDGPQGFDAVGYNWLAQALASRGYLVLQPNYRGSDGDGQALRAAGDGEWGGKIPADLDAGVQNLVSQGLVDPTRVCIVGVGYGGYLALNGAVSGKYRCAAAINGISDIADYAAWMRINRPILDPDDLGGVEVDPTWPGAFRPSAKSYTTLLRYLGSSDLFAISPVHKAAQSAPVLLIRGESDDAVPAEQSRHMAESLKQVGKLVDYTQLDDCDHALTTETCRLAAAEAVTAFLAKYNPAN
ncbi:MAG: S9 family peptidase, partial [Asticcacaulis sp.]|nr:S9 family peptidase [Asticcacaulis sp.]